MFIMLLYIVNLPVLSIVACTALVIRKKSIKAYIEQNKQKKILDWPTSSFGGKPEWTSGPNLYIYIGTV